MEATAVQAYLRNYVITSSVGPNRIRRRCGSHRRAGLPAQLRNYKQRWSKSNTEEVWKPRPCRLTLRCVATGIQPAATVRFHTVVAHDGQLITSTFNRPSASVLFRGVWNLESYAIQRRDDSCHTFAPRRSTIKLRAQRFDPMSLGELQDEGERADVQLDRWTHVALSLSLSLSLSEVPTRCKHTSS